MAQVDIGDSPGSLVLRLSRDPLLYDSEFTENTRCFSLMSFTREVARCSTNTQPILVATARVKAR